MTWFWLLPIISGLADAASRATIKTTDIPVFALNGIGFLAATPLYFLWLYYTGTPEIHPSFWVAVVAHVPLMVIAFTLVVVAHRASPLTLTVPYLSLTPAFLLITAPTMGGGMPSIQGATGVLVIVIGIYILHMREKQRDLLEPLRQLVKERGPQCMFAVGAIFAITSNLDYIALKSANAPFYLLVDHGLIGLICLSIAIFLSIARLHNGKYALRVCHIVPAVFFGTTLALSVIPHMLAFEWIPNVPYVIAGKRAGAIFFTIAIGIIIASLRHFGERHKEERAHLRYRIPGAAVMATGMLLIVYS